MSDINKQQWKAAAKKSRALHFTGSKTSREQMEEMLNKRRHKKLAKKLPKGQTTSLKDGTNFEKVLIEGMEQHNWTLLIACKICMQQQKNAQSLMQTISNSFHMVMMICGWLTLTSQCLLENDHKRQQICQIRYEKSWVVRPVFQVCLFYTS